MINRPCLVECFSQSFLVSLATEMTDNFGRIFAVLEDHRRNKRGVGASPSDIVPS